MFPTNRPVKRAGARQHVMLTLLSFAASVVLTRLFLELTGYPEIGNSTLHIAHVLWGGLLLFIAALLPLVLANRWVYRLSALLGGAGVGLFIDEVGKFITQNNDYFFPAAAPIIYAFFLLLVLLYLQLRRPPARDSRARLYEALDLLPEVLDHDMQPWERRRLERVLHPVAHDQSAPDLALLANYLLQFLAHDKLYLVRTEQGAWNRLLRRARAFEAQRLGMAGIRALAITGLLLLVLYRTVYFLTTLGAYAGTGTQETIDMGWILGVLGASRPLLPVPPGLGLASSGLQVAAVVPLLAAAGLLLGGRDRLGVAIGRAGLVVSLTAIDLVIFYVDQFGAVAGSIVELGLLLLLSYYRQRYMAASGRS